MKRIALALIVFFALSAVAEEKWFQAYDRGVAAVNARNYKAGAEALQKAIAEVPNEGLSLRAGNSLITYVPHFWLGIAKLNLGDIDGAMREFRTSEEQGVVARTDYYASMKTWVARAQGDKQRRAEEAASGAKKSADAAISRALEMQLDALSAGGDRSEPYLAAQRKMQDARAQFQKAGTDVGVYKAAEATAQQARTLFVAAAEEGKKIRAARAAAPPPVKKPAPQPVQQQVAQAAPVQVAPVQQQPVIPTPSPVQQAQVIAPPVVIPTATQPPVLTEAEAAKVIAQQEEKRRRLEAKLTVTAPAAVQRPDLAPAYRAFARGDLASAEQLLTQMVAAQPVAEALLLRGCARYTRAMLSRTPDALLTAAANDFRAALEQNRALRLDARTFSPKLLAFFEDVRERRR
ncbi:MAG: hypothetical protein M3Q69_06540 [Acidobacteriota bacterium]|nr:hypothetical protein [Acidobacteriota bacterium]